MIFQTTLDVNDKEKPPQIRNKTLKNALKLDLDKNNELTPIIAKVSIEYKKIVTQLKEYLCEYLIDKMKNDIKEFLDKNYNIGIIFNLDKLTDGLDDIKDKYQGRFDLLQKDIIKVDNPDEYFEKNLANLNAYDLDGKLEEYEQDVRLKNLLYQFHYFIKNRLLEYKKENPELKITKKMINQIQDGYTVDLLQKISVENLSFNKKFGEIDALLNADDLKDNIKGIFKASLVIVNLKNEILDIFDELGDIIRDEFTKLEEKLEEEGVGGGDFKKLINFLIFNFFY